MDGSRRCRFACRLHRTRKQRWRCGCGASRKLARREFQACRAEIAVATCYGIPMQLIRVFTLSILLATASFAARFGLEHGGKIVKVSDPQISVDGKSIALVVEHANYEDNRYDSDLVQIDTASRAQRVLTHARRTVRQPRWSPDGSRIGFLSSVEGKQQVFVLPMGGGDAWQVTKSPNSVQQYAWRPGGQEIAFVAEDEAPKRTGEERHNKRRTYGSRLQPVARRDG